MKWRNYLADLLRQAGYKFIEKVVIVTGGFDPLHAGHITFFEEAKKLLYQEKLLNSVRLIGISLSNLNTSQEKPTKPKIVIKEAQLSLPF